MSVKKQTPKFKKVNKKLSTAADKLLNLFGSKGQHWINGDEDDGEGNYCLIGGLGHLGYDKNLFDTVLPLGELIDPENEVEVENSFSFGDTPEFNDRDGFVPVKTFLSLLKKGIDPSDLFIGTNGKVQRKKIVTVIETVKV